MKDSLSHFKTELSSILVNILFPEWKTNKLHMTVMMWNKHKGHTSLDIACLCDHLSASQ